MTETKKQRIFGSSRMIIALVGLFGFMNMNSMRVNMSVAIVCMTDQFVATSRDQLTFNESQNIQNISHHKSECNNINNSDDRVLVLKPGEFRWSKQTQGYILGIYFWGYLASQLPGGWLAFRFGSKRVFGWSMFIGSLATLLIPLATRLHVALLILLRLLVGLCQGVTFPAMHGIWSRWAPPWERSSLLGITFSGSHLGGVFALPVSGLLCEYGFNGGWPTIFYFLGILGILWFVAWSYFVYDSPQEHPRVDPEERMYIELALENQMSQEKGDSTIPWKSIFTSVPMWAIVFAHTLSNVGLYTFFTNIPTFFAEVLQIDLKWNGFLSALPFVGFWLMLVAAGIVSDSCIRNKWLTITSARKLCTTIGCLIPAIFLISLSALNCNHNVLSVIFLIIAVAFAGFQWCGYLINHADIAPKYAPLLFGISNTFASIPGFVSTSVIGAITKNKLRSEWRIVFWILAGVYLLSAIIFVSFASGKVQPWALASSTSQQHKLNEGEQQEQQPNDEEAVDLLIENKS